MKINTWKSLAIIAIAIPVLVIPGCTGGGKKPVNLAPAGGTSPPPEIAPPHPPEEDIINDKLPVMAVVEKQAPYLKYEQKRYNLDLQSGDVKDVLLALIRDTDIGLVIDPGIGAHEPPTMLDNDQPRARAQYRIALLQNQLK